VRNGTLEASGGTVVPPGVRSPGSGAPAVRGPGGVAGEWMARAAWPGRVAGREALPPRRCFVSGPEYHDVSLVGVGLPPF